MSRVVKVKLELVDKTYYFATDYSAGATAQWEQKLLSITPLKSTVTLDRKFVRGGFTLVVDDTPGPPSGLGVLQAMFANDTYRKIYGRTATMYIMEADKVTVAHTIVATIRNWSRPGNTVSFECVQEFAGKMDAIPPVIDKYITLATFPDACALAVGQAVRYPTGVLVNQWGWLNEIWKVKNSPRSYLLTWSDPAGPARMVSLQEVYEIYGDLAGVPVDPADISLTRDAAGWEYIEFAAGTTEQLRANVTARSDPAQTGYNPVVALRKVLTDAGVTLYDDGDGGTDDFETFCDTNSWVMGGGSESSVKTIDYLETWALNFNCFWRQDDAGAIHIRHLDWAAITADAVMTADHFLSFVETPDMTSFANRVRSKFGYGNAQWASEVVTDSATGDYLTTAFVKEMNEDYLLAAFNGATNPIAEKLRFFDRVRHVAKCSIDLFYYKHFALDLLKVVDATHYKPIGGAGKYFILEKKIDPTRGAVDLEMIKLWGV